MLHRIAFANAANVQLQFRVCKIHRPGILVQNQIIHIAVGSRSLQVGGFGQDIGAYLGSIARGGAGIVPVAQHRPGSGIAGTVRCLVHLLREGQQVHNLIPNGNGGSGGSGVYIRQVGHAVIVVVNIIQLVIPQQVCVQGGHLGVPVGFTVGIAADDSNGVKHIPPSYAVALGAGGSSCRTAAQQQAERQHRTGQAALHA